MSSEEKAEEDALSSIRFCHFIVKHVDQAFGVGLLVQLSLILVTVGLHLLGSDVFPADFTDVPLELSDHPSYRRVKAWNQREEDPQEVMFAPEFLRNASVSRHEAADVLELYYEAPASAGPDANLFTAATLTEIAKFEASLIRLPHYDKFCVLNAKTSKCRGLRFLQSSQQSCINTNRSILPMLASPSAVENLTGTFANPEIRERLEAMARSDEWRHLLRDALHKDAALDLFPIRTRAFRITPSGRLRSYMTIAWASYSANDFGVPNSTQEFASKVIGPELWRRSQKGIPAPDFTIDFYYYNPYLYYDRLKDEVTSDLMLALGSFLFVLGFLWLQTRSVFITAFGIFGIASNFVGANLIYRYVLDLRYFGVFNVLSVFIILGIGVDDIFVFTDAWFASAAKEFPSLGHRLSEAYARSALSMFITSFTTTAAFVVNAFSPLLAISSFGIFSACLVVFNYLSVITFFPTVIAFYHLRVEPGLCRREGEGEAASRPKRRSSARQRASSIRRGASHFLCSIYKGLIWQPAVQALFLVSLAAGLGFLAYSATGLRVDPEPVRLYIPSHPMGRSLAKRKHDYHQPRGLSLEHVQLYFVWGIKDLDRSHCHKTAWKTCKGKIVWDDDFDLNPYHAQRDLAWFCDYLRRLQTRDQRRLRLKLTDGVPDVNCFIHHMGDFLEREFANSIYSQKRLGGLPTSDTKIEALMMQYPAVYRASEIGIARNSFFDRFFETAAMHWLQAGWSDDAAARENFRRHGSLLGLSLNSSDMVVAARPANRSFVYGNRLRYAAVVVNTTLSQFMGYEEGLPVVREWEELLAKAKRRMSAPLQSGVLMTPDKNDLGGGIHHWLQVQETLTTSALRGVAVSLCLALPVLVLSTDDLVIGGMATLIICATSLSVIGLIPLAGWRLGVLESLNLTLVVGLAIDYIVHVAEAYHLSRKATRREKVDEILQHIGVSVISGAVSTLGASLFMLFAQIAFFAQFGLFIFATVGFSLLYSLGMFIVLLSLIGPETQRFSVSANLRRLLRLPPRARPRDQRPSYEKAADAPVPSGSAPGKAKSRSATIDDDNVSSGYDTAETRVTTTTELGGASGRSHSAVSLPFSDDSAPSAQHRGFLPAILNVGPPASLDGAASHAPLGKHPRRPRSRNSTASSQPTPLATGTGLPLPLQRF